MALEEVKQLGGTHVVAVGRDPTTGKMYALPVNPTTGQVETSSGSVESEAQGASVDVNDSGTADVDAAVAAQAGLRLMGYSVRESAGTAAVASLRIMHGATVAGGTVVCRINLNADESERMWFGPDGISCPNGISIDRQSGSTEVDIYHKTVV